MSKIKTISIDIETFSDVDLQKVGFINMCNPLCLRYYCLDIP